jgi:nucleoside-diphosphate-sugar epimerase
MRLIITGANGFIGSHVVRESLARGHETFAAIRPGASVRRLADVIDRVTVIDGDLGDTSSIRRRIEDIRPDSILHLAWYAEPGRYAHDTGQNLASLRASTRLLDAAVQAGCPRVVLAGTCLESAAGPARSIYQVSKRAIHSVAEIVATPSTSIACGHVFHLLGPGEDERRVVPSVVRALLRSEPVATTDGAQRRDYLHVADVASGFCALAEASVPGGIDICTGSPIRLRDLFEMIGAETGRRDLIRIGDLGPSPDEGHPETGDPRPLRELGWEPRFDLRQGLIDSINWWRTEGGQS